MKPEQSRNFYGLIELQVLQESEREFMDIGMHEWLKLSWLHEMSGRYANVLIQLGCQEGDRVAAQVDKSHFALALYYGCLRIGCCYMPLNTAYTSVELEHLLRDGEPKVLVGQEDERPRELAPEAMYLTLKPTGEGTLGVIAEGASSDVKTVQCNGDTVANLLYTSGTTGKPKGALISHNALVQSALSLGNFWRFTKNDTLLHALPIFHAHGLMVAANVALAAGAKIILQKKFDPKQVVERITESTVFMGVPTLYHRLLVEPGLDAARSANVRLFTSGSAPLSPEIFQAFEARTGHRIVERYGATETMILCSNPLDGERRAGSVGVPIPGVEVRVADANDKELPQGGIGMIQVRSPSLFSGYLNLPAETAKEFTADGWFRTGDLGQLSEDGYVSITGRAKDLIISGGYNVYPAEVESTINAMPAVLESAVVGVPHVDFGEAVVAFVIPARRDVPPEAQDVVRWAKERLANYKVPKTVLVVDEFPRNAMGKVLKAKLRRQLQHDA